MSSPGRYARLGAVLQALLVTFLWSSSWVLIKIGLQDLPALTFAGLRYFVAFLILLPLALRPAHRSELRSLTAGGWARLVALGLLFYTITQGAQFLGLFYLPSVTVSLLLNFTTISVALLGIVLLAERPTWLQWTGVGLNAAGIVIYFYPAALPAGQVVGIIIVLVGVLANAGSSLLGRRVNREKDITFAALGVGPGSGGDSDMAETADCGAGSRCLVAACSALPRIGSGDLPCLRCNPW